MPGRGKKEKNGSECVNARKEAEVDALNYSKSYKQSDKLNVCKSLARMKKKKK